MRRILLTCVLLAALPAHAALEAASVLPARSKAGSSVDTTLNITWRITTDAAHIDGAISAGGELLDAVTGTRLAAVNTSLGTLTGTGPIIYPESLTITAAQVTAWRAQGVRLLGYRRTFTSRTLPNQAAQILISLTGVGLEAARAADSGELRILRMELSFAGGRRIEIVERGAALDARLTLAYSGSGTLRARWEVADPAGAAEPFFRVLAHVREPLAGERQHLLESPPLPTNISGRYVLRFCIEGREAVDGAACASSDTTVQTLYEVTPGSRTRLLTGLTPDNRAVDAATPFGWPAVDGVTTYQLQIFRGAEPAPVFVAGMLLDSSITRTALSDVTRGKLTPGQRYLWRITAHDADGQLLANSAAATFVYLPTAGAAPP